MSKSEKGYQHSEKVWVGFKDWRNEEKPVILKKLKVKKQPTNRLETLDEHAP